MVPTLQLWLPILLSAVGVFATSSIIHMVLRYHRTDFAALPDEDAALAALQPLGIPPGEYVIPFMQTPDALKDPAYVEKVKKGPVAFIAVMPPSKVMSMGPQLVQWFGYLVIVSMFAAYVTGRALGPGAEYMEVFRFAGTTAFGAYALGLMQNSIWYSRSWSATLKSMLDGFIYGCVTAGFFGWLWP